MCVCTHKITTNVKTMWFHWVAYCIAYCITHCIAYCIAYLYCPLCCLLNCLLHCRLYCHLYSLLYCLLYCLLPGGRVPIALPIAPRRVPIVLPIAHIFHISYSRLHPTYSMLRTPYFIPYPTPPTPQAKQRFKPSQPPKPAPPKTRLIGRQISNGSNTSNPIASTSNPINIWLIKILVIYKSIKCDYEYTIKYCLLNYLVHCLLNCLLPN